MITTTTIMITPMATIAAAGTTTSMAETAEVQRQQWFSPAFPVGGYAYSHGIEKAVETGDIHDAASLASWVEDILRLGAGRSDAILLGEAWRRAGDLAGEAALADLAEFGIALGLSRERRLETAQQGAAFYQLVGTAWPETPLPSLGENPLPYPVAVGIAGRVHGQPLVPLASAYLQAFASNLIAAGLRLAVIGQSAAQVRLAALLPVIRAVAAEAEGASLEDLGGMAFRSDLMSIRHETQVTRLFRS
jgi:urease accessory protein